MSEDEAARVIAELQRPRTIYAPDGSTFVVIPDVNADVQAVEYLNDTARFMLYTVQGPNGNSHTWIAAWDGTFLPDPDGDNIPANWRLKAEIALAGWLRYCDEGIP